MRKKTLAGAAALALSLSLTACGDSDDMSDNSMTETSSASTQMNNGMAVSGQFEGLNGKNVSGMANIDGDTLTLSDFASEEAPDLHVYLTNGTDEAAVDSGMEIDEVDFDGMNQEFKLSDVNASDYSNVVIHCDKAKAVFGAATLS